MHYRLYYTKYQEYRTYVANTSCDFKNLQITSDHSLEIRTLRILYKKNSLTFREFLEIQTDFMLRLV